METITEIPKLKPRADDAHKGNLGKVCTIAGSVGISSTACPRPLERIVGLTSLFLFLGATVVNHSCHNHHRSPDSRQRGHIK